MPLAGALGIEVLEADEATARVRLPPSPLSLRPGRTASGPALMTLADVAVWAPVLLSEGGEDPSRTAQLSVAFLRPAGDRGAIAESRVVRSGRRVLYAEVWMRGEGEERPCAHATTTWMRAAP